MNNEYDMQRCIGWPVSDNKYDNMGLHSIDYLN